MAIQKNLPKSKANVIFSIDAVATYIRKPRVTGVQSGRLWEIDAARGVAVVMMVVYHFVFNLYFFQITSTIFTNPFWFYFQRITASLFIFLVGVSLAILRRTSDGSIPYNKLLNRGARIFAWGLLISAVTLVVLGRDAYIRFGILHFIGLSIAIAYPFLRLRWSALLLGVALIAVGVWLQEFRFEAPWTYLFWLGFEPDDHYYVDYFPFIRWFGVVLLGIGVGNLFYDRGARRDRLPAIAVWTPVTWLAYLGQRSLPIYLLHQPLLFVIMIPLLLLFGIGVVRF